MQETHTCFFQATALPTPAYAAACSQAAADLDLMSLCITDHLIPSTTLGPLPHLCQQNIHLDNMPYAPNSRLPTLNRLARPELELAMDEANQALHHAHQWGQPPPRDQR